VTTTPPTSPGGSTAEVEHVDVLIVGAGLSGIGAACHLQTEAPGTSYAILEARGSSGGTWDLFRYPGVRSDSDMFTLGYSFRPWTRPKSIADGSDILAYVRETADAYGVEQHIRYARQVTAATWSSEQATWTVTVEHADTASTAPAPATSCTCALATTATTRATPPTGPAASSTKGSWCTRSTGRTAWT